MKKIAIVLLVFSMIITKPSSLQAKTGNINFQEQTVMKDTLIKHLENGDKAFLFSFNNSDINEVVIVNELKREIYVFGTEDLASRDSYGLVKTFPGTAIIGESTYTDEKGLTIIMSESENHIIYKSIIYKNGEIVSENLVQKDKKSNTAISRNENNSMKPISDKEYENMINTKEIEELTLADLKKENKDNEQILAENKETEKQADNKNKDKNLNEEKLINNKESTLDDSKTEKLSKVKKTEVKEKNATNINSKEIKVITNNKQVIFSDQRPAIIEGRILIPIRGVFEELRFNISWNAKERKVTIEDNDNKVEMWVNKSVFLINNQEVITEVSPQIINERIMLPLRSIGEAIGSEIDWNQNTKTGYITYKDERTDTNSNEIKKNKNIQAIEEVKVLSIQEKTYPRSKGVIDFGKLFKHKVTDFHTETITIGTDGDLEQINFNMYSYSNITKKEKNEYKDHLCKIGFVNRTEDMSDMLGVTTTEMLEEFKKEVISLDIELVYLEETNELVIVGYTDENAATLIIAYIHQ